MKEKLDTMEVRRVILPTPVDEVKIALPAEYLRGPKDSIQELRKILNNLKLSQVEIPLQSKEVKSKVIHCSDLTDVEKVAKEIFDVNDFLYCIYVMGGAGGVDSETQLKLNNLFTGLFLEVEFAAKGEILAGDGGTDSGVMRALGLARKMLLSHGLDVPLVGVFPEEEVDYGDNDPEKQGKTKVDPNNSINIPYSNKNGEKPEWGKWGEETEFMYKLFKALAHGKKSMGIAANGGGITLKEIAENIKQGRKVIVIEGSGRASDLLCHFLKGGDFKDITDPGQKKLSDTFLNMAQLFGSNKDKFIIFNINSPVKLLADIVKKELEIPVINPYFDTLKKVAS